MEVVQGIETHPEHLFRQEEVAQVRPRIGATDQAGAGRVHRRFVPRILGVLDQHTPKRGEQPAGPAMTGGHDAVEQVHTVGDSFDEVFRRAHPHQVSWGGLRQLGHRRVKRGVHHLFVLPHAQAAERIAVEPDLHQRGGRARAQARIMRPLDDAEEQLIGPATRIPTAPCPPRRPHERGFGGVLRRGIPQTFVEGHRHIGAERFLNLDHALGRQVMQRAVQVGLERHAVVRHLAERRQTEYLVAPAIGQDRPRPSHEPVQTAQFRDQLMARPEIEMVGVAEDHLEAQPGEVVGGEPFDRGLGPHRHERRGLDHAVRGRELADACP